MRLNILLLFLCFLLVLTGPVFALSPVAIKTIAPLQTVTQSHLTVIPSVITTVKTTETVSFGSVTIESDPFGAEIWMFGNKTPYRTPYSSPAYPWSYSIALIYPGYKVYTESFTLQSGQSYTISAKLVPLTTTPAQSLTGSQDANGPVSTPTAQTTSPQISVPAAVFPTTTGGGEASEPQTIQAGSLSITTNPAGAEIFIDGIPAGASPATIPGLSARPHNLTITMPGYADLITQVNVLDGQTMDYSTTLIPATEPTKPKAPGFEAAVAGLALAGVVLLKRRG